MSVAMFMVAGLQESLWCHERVAGVPVAANQLLRTTGQVFPSVQCRDFGYLAWCDGCCDDAEDFLLEVLGGESYNSLCRVGLRAAGVQHVGLRVDQEVAVRSALNLVHV